MDLLRDIKNILKDDREHHLRVEVDYYFVKVYLEYDPEMNFEEKTIIPIEYTIIEEFAYIPDDEYRNRFTVNDYGLDLNEITLIKEIMEYLESHKQEITELCSGYLWEDREDECEND